MDKLKKKEQLSRQIFFFTECTKLLFNFLAKFITEKIFLNFSHFFERRQFCRKGSNNQPHNKPTPISDEYLNGGGTGKIPFRTRSDSDKVRRGKTAAAAAPKKKMPRAEHESPGSTKV